METSVNTTFGGSEAATAPYWDGLAAGTLRIQRCNDCNEAYFHPRPFCPFCSSRSTDWFECSGDGVIYSYTVDYRHKAAPMVFAFVTLAEGPTILTRITTDNPGSLAVGAPVAAGFDVLPDGTPGIYFKA